MRLWKKRDRKNFDDLSSRIDDLERNFKTLELDLDLYVKRLRASRGLGKFKKEEEEKTKDIKSEVLLNPDGSFLSEKQKERNS